ncbi:hypothetical protein TL16_g03810 [Triparma laevis f. inornata]|uniref:G-protein coupled receptors family 3 profile domain-containing protein n=1 Tax=Triparma laevis f. inornata TaxID=1714386 RepID=A0A9W7A8G3_9STRA|nr:hypothetical protein TL16_g03810 [Triparma laevis f. inornata]
MPSFLSSLLLTLLTLLKLQFTFATCNVDYSVAPDDPTCMSRCYDDMNGWTFGVTDPCSYFVGTGWTRVNNYDLAPWATGTESSITSDKCSVYKILTTYSNRVYLYCHQCASGYIATESGPITYLGVTSDFTAIDDCVQESSQTTNAPTSAAICTPTDTSSDGDRTGDKCDKYKESTTWCGKYDDEDFQSNDMCCNCGGGCTDPSGCGSGPSPTPTTAPKITLVDTSAGSTDSTCKVTGNCFYTGEPGSGSVTAYSKSERCAFTTDMAAVLKVSSWQVENPTSSGTYYDRITMPNNVQYGGESGPTPDSQTVQAGQTINWQSDGSVQKKGFAICLERLTSAPTSTPTSSPTKQGTASPTKSGATAAPTKAPSKAPTESPTKAPSKSPTIAPTVFESQAPTAAYSCNSKCWTGVEDCCDRISTNLYATSQITSRILFYDLENSNYKTFLEAGNSPPCEKCSDMVQMENVLGGGHLAFSSKGSEIYYARPKHGDDNGGIESFDAQTGAFKRTIIDSLTSEETDFDPGILRVLSFGDEKVARIFSERSSGKLYLLTSDAIKDIFVNPLGCEMIDVAAEYNSASSSIQVLIASSCDSTADRVDKIEVDGTSFEPSPDPASPGAALATLATGFDVVSVEWVDDGSDSDSLTSTFWNGLIDSHVLEYQIADITSPTNVLKLADLDSTRDGIKLGMIRRAPNHLVYASEREFGLPLIIDPDITGEDEDKVIGQTGAKHGDLADSFSIAFSPNAYGLKSFVSASRIGETIVAGQEYPFGVDLRDSSGNDVQAYNALEANVKGNVNLVSDGQQFKSSVSIKLDDDIVQDISQKNLYEGTLMVEKASTSGKDEADKWEMQVGLSGLGMDIGGPVRFWVVAGNTSAATTMLSKTYEESTAGKTVELIVESKDKYGNPRTFDDVTGDMRDLDKFAVISVGDVNNRADDHAVDIERVDSGTFKMSITSNISQPFTYDVTFDGVPIANSPAHMVFKPAEFSAETSEAIGSSLTKFIPSNVDQRPNTFKIFARDQFRNIIRSSIHDHVNITLIAVQKRKVLYEERNFWELMAGEEPSSHQAGGGQDVTKTISESEIETIRFIEPDGSILVSFVVVDPYVDHLKLTVNFTLTGDCIQHETVPLDNFKIRPSLVITVKTVGTEEMIIIMGIAAFVVIYTAFFAFLVWCWRAENAIKFSQRKLLNLLLVGIFIVNLTIMCTTFPSVIEWRYSCMLYVWGAIIGLSLIEFTLIAKLWRVHSIAYAPAQARVKITDDFLMKRITIGMAAMCLYSLVASIIDPLKKVRITSPKAVLYEYGTEHFVEISECPWNSEVWYPIGFVVITALICECAMATQSRKIPSAFAESKWIALSMYTLALCLCFVGFLVWDKDLKFKRPAFYHAGVATPISLASFVFMNLMFGPKFRKIIRGKRMEFTDIKPKEDDGSVHSGDGVQLQRMTGVARGNSVRRSVPKRGSSRWSVGSFIGSPLSSRSGFVMDEESSAGGGLGGRSNSDLEEKHAAEIKKMETKYKALEEQYKRREQKFKETMKKEEQRRRQAREIGDSGLERAPEGSNWKIFYDQAGNPYYYNIDSEECSYTKPDKWF